MVTIAINGRERKVENGITVLEAVQSEGIDIPTLCYHKALKSYGGCRLCVVEVEGPGLRKMVRTSCNLIVSESLRVETESLRISATRKQLLSLYLSLAPKPRASLLDMAKRFGATEPFIREKDIDLCTRCTLCIRVCREKIGASALTLAKPEGPVKGPTRSIRLIREACFGGGTCASICPSGILTIRDEGSERSMLIRGRSVATFELTNCESCGRPYVTQSYRDRIQSRLPADEGKQIKNICPECARQYYTVALTGRFTCGES